MRIKLLVDPEHIYNFLVTQIYSEYVIGDIYTLICAYEMSRQKPDKGDSGSDFDRDAFIKTIIKERTLS